jgi:hypothetical protein
MAKKQSLPYKQGIELTLGCICHFEKPIEVDCSSKKPNGSFVSIKRAFVKGGSVVRLNGKEATFYGEEYTSTKKPGCLKPSNKKSYFVLALP